MAKTSLKLAGFALMCGIIAIAGRALAKDAAAGKDAAPAAKGAPATPPTLTDPWEHESDWAKINQQWASIEAILKDPEYFKIQDQKTSKWSCGIHAAHMMMVLKMIADGIDANLADPERDKNGKHSPLAKGVFTRGIIPRGVGKAPDIVMPMIGTREGWLRQLEETRARWAKFEAEKRKLADCPSRFKHFAFGYLTSADWVRFAGIHTAHHLKIVRDVLEKSGEAGKPYGAELK